MVVTKRAARIIEQNAKQEMQAMIMANQRTIEMATPHGDVVKTERTLARSEHEHTYIPKVETTAISATAVHGLGTLRCGRLPTYRAMSQSQLAGSRYPGQPR